MSAKRKLFSRGFFAKQKRLKGIELPINTLVVVAVAVIILLGVVAFFMGGFGPVSASMQKRQEFLNECQPYVQLGCQGDPSSTIQNKYYNWIENAPTKTAGNNKAELDKIKQSCGCFGGTGGISGGITTQSACQNAEGSCTASCSPAETEVGSCGDTTPATKCCK